MSVQRAHTQAPDGSTKITLTATGVDAADLLMIQVPRSGRIEYVRGTINSNNMQPRLLSVEDNSVPAFGLEEVAAPLEASVEGFYTLIDVPYLLDGGQLWWHVGGSASGDDVELEVLISPARGSAA